MRSWDINPDSNHRGAVLSVVMSSTGEQCFSGGVDGTIQCWNTPNPNIDPYDSYGKVAPPSLPLRNVARRGSKVDAR